MEEFLKSLSKKSNEIKKMNKEAKIMDEYEHNVAKKIAKSKVQKEPKRSSSPTTITHDFDEKTSKVKKTKKQMLLEAKEEKDKQNREELAKEANEKQLLFMKKFHPEQYEALMNVKKEEPKPEPKPKKINIKRGNKAKMENEKAIKDKELELEKEHYKLLMAQDKLRIEKDVGEIMKGKSELIKKGKKMSVETELDIKKGLQKKVKNALRKSIIDEIDKKLIGSGLYDSSSSEESSSDEEEIDNYSKILNHLLSHIKDPKEKTDKKDIRDAKSLITSIEKVKRKRSKKN